MNIKKYFFICILLFATIITSCLENQEGCLEPNASNYDIGATKNCCCTYPKFNVNQTMLYQGANIGTESKFLFEGDTISIDTLAFFTSNWILFSAGEPFTARERTAGLEVDDLTLINFTNPSSEIGTIDFYGSYDALNYQIGPQNFWNTIDTSRLEENHPWRAGIIRPDKNPVLLYLKATKYNIDTTETIVERQIPLATAIPGSVTKNYAISRQGGLTLNAVLDLEMLFNGFDLFNSDNETFKTKVGANLSGAFSVN